MLFLIAARSLLQHKRRTFMLGGAIAGVMVLLVVLLGVSVGNLQNADAVQMTLPFERADMIQLETAVDAVRDRFGSASLTSAGSIGTDAGFTMPMLPD